MLNFTVGPVMSNEEIRKIGGEQIPYFRTSEFSKIMLDSESLLKKFFKAKDSSKVIFMTGSGTASMDASVLNLFTKNDKILVVNGGSFGHRFCEICSVYDLDYTEIKCELGKTLTKEQLVPYDNKGYTAFIVNLDETSTGVLYDINLISDFCKKNNLFLLVDSISSFLCDPFDMDKLNVNCVITGSQKALALAPGISLIVVDDKAIDRIYKNNPKTYYFNLKDYLDNGKRGQTPFTPAVGILLQLNRRLHMIEDIGGIDVEVKRAEMSAKYFRDLIKELPFEIVSDNLSNAVTPLSPKDESKSAYKLFELLKDNYGIWVCPNGGNLKDKIFRVGHIGDIKNSDYDKLIYSIKDIIKKNLW
ncbi:MAG: aminotransferase class V-fold PLP-dependent enzyme [Acholeplasmatales bacterium]|nr:aminotransferase class V-fold PLP-dependent enzyme [Acholeplasmatales bacterium]